MRFILPNSVHRVYREQFEVYTQTTESNTDLRRVYTEQFTVYTESTQSIADLHRVYTEQFKSTQSLHRAIGTYKESTQNNLGLTQSNTDLHIANTD